MNQNLIEYLRKVSVISCFGLSAFHTGWKVWKSEIDKVVAGRITPASILDIGDILSHVFKSTGGTGRGQSSLSGAGYAWEGLVCWYLNLCFIGSRGVAIRKTSDLPNPLKDAMSVNYGNFRSNTESDITIVVFPDKPEFTRASISPSNLGIKNKSLKSTPSNRDITNTIKHFSELYFDEFELGIIQCKTNWNENAQVPMLWSMIYEAKSFNNTNISIGKNGFSMHDLKKFTYSFCTVPTNDISTFKQDSTSVNRVRNITGGNYWGNPTLSGVASSIKEIFNTNFRSAFSPNQRVSINKNIRLLDSDYGYFDLI